MAKKINSKSEYLNPKQFQNSNVQISQTIKKSFYLGHSDLLGAWDLEI
jgi:hypothetical protein